MLLAVDIGNTNISFAVMKGGRVVHKIILDKNKKPEIRKKASKVLIEVKRKYLNINDAIICSVVPLATNDVKFAINKVMGLNSIVVGKDIKVPILNKYRKPENVGQDRLVCAYAAKYLYGCPVIVIDLGTAITFDIISAFGVYEGGLIIPGIRLSAESLFNNTALLPMIDDIKSPKRLIGKTTRESILSGIFNGYGAMCLGLIDRLTAELSKKPKVVVTGGHTKLMKKYIEKKITAVESSLVFKGMYLLHKK